MPGTELAQYGLATFAVAGLLYTVSLFVNKKKDNELSEVIENNTKALNSLSNVIQSIQLSLVRQEQKIDELLERARR
ncbi:hypothetical protein TthWC1_2489 [Thermoanaerobacter thermohydrosulfuricus WC1]|uniref:Uncharacterized protein n=1 Tax=Thermoanaerobacter thermohydrosulfuricus WC1 TaxID=1198630 RepID=M8CLA4_THETY|nr:hypothetical protein [Thermoanaerobacter thermohydrosulfuricus]EMT38005.1 hypothetical protein TthWC1_2489 [Thermoanaerobacter thermohydrosulfuricus WC1]